MNEWLIGKDGFEFDIPVTWREMRYGSKCQLKQVRSDLRMRMGFRLQLADW